MKYILKIKNSNRLGNSNTKMVHENVDGKLFLGPLINASAKDTVIVEASDTEMEDGYYHIIKIVKIIRN